VQLVMFKPCLFLAAAAAAASADRVEYTHTDQNFWSENFTATPISLH
jgi:hypothetical protein